MNNVNVIKIIKHILNASERKTDRKLKMNWSENNKRKSQTDELFEYFTEKKGILDFKARFQKFYLISPRIPQHHYSSFFMTSQARNNPKYCSAVQNIDVIMHI